MNQNDRIKIFIALILFATSVILFSLAVSKYQVLTSSRADEGLSPTPTVPVTLTPTVTTMPEGTGAGFTDFPNVEDDSYTAPLPLDQVTAAMREAAARAGGHCNIDTKQCTGWAWKYVCTVDSDVVWDTRSNNDSTKNTLYNRHCTKQTGSTQDIGVKFDTNGMSIPSSSSQVYKLNDVGCGKLVQVDVTEGNCEPDIGTKSCAAIKDYLVYYTGSCPPPTPTATPTITLTPSPTSTPTSTPTGTLTPSVTPTITLTPTLTNTPTVTPIPTNTPIPTSTPIPPPTYTPAPTSTQGPQATYTPQPTYSPYPTVTPITKLAIKDQPPGITPWVFITIPIGIILLGLLL